MESGSETGGDSLSSDSLAVLRVQNGSPRQGHRTSDDAAGGSFFQKRCSIDLGTPGRSRRLAGVSLRKNQVHLAGTRHGLPPRYGDRGRHGVCRREWQQKRRALSRDAHGILQSGRQGKIGVEPQAGIDAAKRRALHGICRLQRRALRLVYQRYLDSERWKKAGVEICLSQRKNDLWRRYPWSGHSTRSLRQQRSPSVYYQRGHQDA